MTNRGFGKTIAAVLGTLLLVSGAAFAHGPPGEKRDPAQRQAKVEQRVRERLAPKLGADEKTTARLVEIFQQAAEERAAAGRQIREERQALAAMVASKASPRDLDAQLVKLEDALSRQPSKHAVLAQTREVLTPQQQATLVLSFGRGGGKGPGGHHRGGR